MFIVTKQIDGENISKVCRTCLREDNDRMLCLFIGPAGSSLSAKLQSLSGLEVLQGDGLPEKMCDRCVTRTESALLFREQCRAADQALRQAAIRVFNAKAYSNVPACDVYQQNQNFVPFQYSQNTPTFTDYRPYENYQEFYVPNRLHPPFYQTEENRPQQMRIIESHNNYLDLGLYGNASTGHEFLGDTAPSVIRSNHYDQLNYARYNSDYSTESCGLQCSLCNYTFNNSTQLANHSVSHNSANLDLSSDEVHIEVEENSNHERNSYERPISQSIQQSMENVSYNQINSACNSDFQNFNFAHSVIESGEVNVINSSLISHETKIPTQSEFSTIIKNNRFKCDICFKLFSQKSKLEAHHQTHNRKKPFECYHCGKSYSSKSKLAAHTRLHTQTNVHQCRICQKIFSYPSYLSEHMKTHSTKSIEQKASFECLQCKKQFQFEKSYKRHMKFHTGKGLFHCDICDKLFSQKYLLKVHMQSHESFRFHKCDLCDKSFNQRSNLVEHMRTHTKIKPFKCNICEKSFVQSSHLKSHEASHNSIRKFQCRICGKGFKLASHLKRHVNLHTGLKMYKCDQCDQMFSQAFSLKRHSKKHIEANL